MMATRPASNSSSAEGTASPPPENKLKTGLKNSFQLLSGRYRAKRPGAKASSAILAPPVRMRSAIARPMAGPSRIPLRPAPVAMYTCSIPGTR